MSGPCLKCGGAWGADTPICPACGGSERGRLPDPGTTRRIISDFFLDNRSLIMPHVLEVGSARPADAWWADLRSQLEMQDEEWTGVDMQDSDCTDIVFDLAAPAATLDALIPDMHSPGYGSCVCAETLEHVNYPANMLGNIHAILRPGAWIVITSPFAFPVHGFPEDYWRFTPSGMQLLLKDAGFENYQALELGLEPHTYHDHIMEDPYMPPPTDQEEFMKRAAVGSAVRALPLWIGAIARKPE